MANGLQDRRGFENYMKFGVVLSSLGFISPVVLHWYYSVLIILLGGLIYCIAKTASNPPSNNMVAYQRFLRRNDNINGSTRSPVLVCVGDSIMHGKLTADITTQINPILRSKLNYDAVVKKNSSSSSSSSSTTIGDDNHNALFREPLWVVNAAQNGLVTYAVLNQRLPYIMSCYPDYVCIMLGTKDLLTMTGSGSSDTKTWNLPEPISYENFQSNLASIVDFIRSNSPKTRVGICTIPPIGENVHSQLNYLNVKQINTIIEEVVNKFNVIALSEVDNGANMSSEDNDYSNGGFTDGTSYSHTVTAPVSVIDVYKMMERELKLKPKKWNHLSSERLRLSYPITTTMNIILHHYLGISYDSISSNLFGHSFLVDTVHLTEDTAELVANEIVGWLLKCNIQKAIVLKRF